MLMIVGRPVSSNVPRIPEALLSTKVAERPWPEISSKTSKFPTPTLFHHMTQTATAVEIQIPLITPMQPPTPPDAAFEPASRERSAKKASHVNATLIGLSALAVLALAGVIIANVYSATPLMAVQVTVSVLCGLIFLVCVLELRRRWVIADPNEWLLVIENGMMIRSGVGMRHFRGLTETCVRFPSSIQRVSFSASQVTKEMQGLLVSGFAIWGINRTGYGPFNAYKMLDGLSETGLHSANENIKRMAESIIRHQVSNLSINEMLTQRELVRNKVKTEMMEVVSGWGMWLETVEITDVQISSHRLFEDLQSDFRARTHREAEMLRMKLDKEIETEQIQVRLAGEKEKAQAESERLVFAAHQDLNREQEAFESWKGVQAILREKIESEQKTELLRLQSRLAVQEADVVRRKAEQEFEHAMLAAKLKVEEGMSAPTLSRMQLEAMETIYAKLSELKVVSMVGGDAGLGSLLPGIAAAVEQVKALK